MMLGACSSMNPLNKNINKGVKVDEVKLRGGSEVPDWFFDYPKDESMRIKSFKYQVLGCS